MVADVLALRASGAVDGISFPVADPSDSSPFAFVANGLSFTGNDLLVASRGIMHGFFLAK